MLRAAALVRAGVLIWQQGDYALARAHIEESLSVWRRPGLEQSRELAFALHILGHVRFDQRDYAAAQPLFAESLAINQARGEPLETMALTGDFGLVACHLGDYAAARARFEQGLAQARAQDSRDGIALHLVRLGDLARLEGDYERAAPMYAQSLTLCREIGDVLDIAASLHKLGQVARRRGDLDQARMLLMESLGLQQSQGNQQGIVEGVAGLAGVAVNAGKLEIAAQLFGALILFQKGLPYAGAVWGLLPMHIEFLLIGWTLQLVMGVASWILPRFSRGSPRGDERLVWLAYFLLNAGALSVSLGAWLRAPVLILLLGRLGELAAALLFALHAWPLLKPQGA